jgi:GntR family histidine utilization transcriptional repressor
VNLKSHREVKTEILSRIRARDWLPGEFIPPESELAETYGCARTTVNRALRALAEAGVVERRRKAGTRVLATAPRNAKFEIPVVRLEILKTGAAYRYERLDRALLRPPATIGEAMQLASNSMALYVRCRHWADERVHQLEERWINLETVPAARGEKFEVAGPNEWLVERVPLSRARHTFSAEEANPQTANDLKLALRDPLFVIERVTWIESCTITWARLVHPGRVYRLVAETSQP